MKHFLLFYTYTSDRFLERRTQYREAHLKYAWESQERGELLLGGAISDPLDGGLLVFRAESPDVAAEFARSDPYVTNGLVTNWRVREWLTVVGTDAAAPLRPASLTR